MITVNDKAAAPLKRRRALPGVLRELTRNKSVYIMAIPLITYYILFAYLPMYGILLAFKNYSPKLGIMASEWVGFKHFISFFTTGSAWELIGNTFLMSFYDLLWGFPAPIILALLLNEIRNRTFKRSIQTLTYLPYFVSVVVICGIIKDFLSREGLVNDLINMFGLERQNFLAISGAFRTIMVSTNIWQGIGWGSIIYLSALSGIDAELYDAAMIDGAGKWRQTVSVTLPGIAPTIVVLLILRCGSLLSVGYEKIILLYNPLTYATADVISTFTYRKGLIDANYGYSTAVSLFNSVINFIFLYTVNKISRTVSESSLW